MSSSNKGQSKGPTCSHCGIDSTPRWRNGPKGKPLLCNACGTRYIQYGSFKNYLPKHCKKEHLNNLDQNVKKARNNFYNLGDLWDFEIPRRKRSRVVYKKITPMEKFHKQLLNMWMEMKPNEESREEDVLLYNVNNFIPSNEIGLGCSIVHIKPSDGSST